MNWKATLTRWVPGSGQSRVKNKRRRVESLLRDERRFDWRAEALEGRLLFDGDPVVDPTAQAESNGQEVAPLVSQLFAEAAAGPTSTTTAIIGAPQAESQITLTQVTGDLPNAPILVGSQNPGSFTVNGETLLTITFDDANANDSNSRGRLQITGVGNETFQIQLLGPGNNVEATGDTFVPDAILLTSDAQTDSAGFLASLDAHLLRGSGNEGRVYQVKVTSPQAVELSIQFTPAIAPIQPSGSTQVSGQVGVEGNIHFIRLGNLTGTATNPSADAILVSSGITETSEILPTIIQTGKFLDDGSFAPAGLLRFENVDANGVDVGIPIDAQLLDLNNDGRDEIIVLYAHHLRIQQLAVDGTADQLTELDRSMLGLTPGSNDWTSLQAETLDDVPGLLLVSETQLVWAQEPLTAAAVSTFDLPADLNGQTLRAAAIDPEGRRVYAIVSGSDSPGSNLSTMLVLEPGTGGTLTEVARQTGLLDSANKLEFGRLTFASDQAHLILQNDTFHQAITIQNDTFSVGPIAEGTGTLYDADGNGLDDLISKGLSTSLNVTQPDQAFAGFARFRDDQAPADVVTDYVLGDFNGDGVFDAIYGDESAGKQASFEFALGVSLGRFQASGNDQSGGGADTGEAAIPGPERGFVSGDFNQDGRDDVLFINDDGQARILLGRGYGLLQAGIDVNGFDTTLDYGRDIVTGDFNGDGDIDFGLLSRADENATAFTMQWFLGNGLGEFRQVATQLNIESPGNAVRLATVDSNDDGITDFVTSHVDADGNWLVQLHDGSALRANMTAIPIEVLRTQANDLVAGGGNAANRDALEMKLAVTRTDDGVSMIAASLSRNENSAVEIIRVSPAAIDGEPPIVTPATLAGVTNGEVRDLDFFKTSSERAQLVVTLADRIERFAEVNGQWASVQTLTASADFTETVVIEPINSEGTLSLVAGLAGSNQVAKFDLDDNDSFQAAEFRELPLGGSALRLVAGNFVQSDRNDFVYRDASGQVAGVFVEETFDPFVSPGQGLLATLDWNGDGTTDYATIGDFGQIIVLMSDVDSESPVRERFNLGEDFIGVTTGVVDGELVLYGLQTNADDVANVVEYSIDIRLDENGDPIYEFTEQEVDLEQPLDQRLATRRLIAQTEFDPVSDGTVILTQGFIASSPDTGDAPPNSEVRLEIGSSDGVSEAYTRLINGAVPDSILRVGDQVLIGDGGITGTISVVDLNGNVLQRLRTTNDTRVAFNDRLTGFGGPAELVASDINGDGIEDLIVLNRSTQTVTTRLGLGNGLFGEIEQSIQLPQNATDITIASRPSDPSDPSSPQEPWLIVTQDSDEPEVLVYRADGQLDARSQTINKSILILRSNGAGGFEAVEDGLLLTVPGQPNEILARDINQDGFDDLVFRNDQGDVFVFQGQDVENQPFRSLDNPGDNNVNLAVNFTEVDGTDESVTTVLTSSEERDRVQGHTGPQETGATYTTIGDQEFDVDSPSEPQLLDLDGDGNLDLIYTNAASNQLLIRFGGPPNGNQATFGEEVAFAVGANPTEFAVTGIENGELTIAVLNSGSGDISVVFVDAQASKFGTATLANPSLRLNLDAVANVQFESEEGQPASTSSATPLGIGFGINEATGRQDLLVFVRNEEGQEGYGVLENLGNGFFNDQAFSGFVNAPSGAIFSTFFNGIAYAIGRDGGLRSFNPRTGEPTLIQSGFIGADFLRPFNLDSATYIGVGQSELLEFVPLDGGDPVNPLATSDLNDFVFTEPNSLLYLVDADQIVTTAILTLKTFVSGDANLVNGDSTPTPAIAGGDVASPAIEETVNVDAGTGEETLTSIQNSEGINDQNLTQDELAEIARAFFRTMVSMVNDTSELLDSAQQAWSETLAANLPEEVLQWSEAVWPLLADTLRSSNESISNWSILFDAASTWWTELGGEYELIPDSWWNWIEEGESGPNPLDDADAWLDDETLDVPAAMLQDFS